MTSESGRWGASMVNSPAAAQQCQSFVALTQCLPTSAHRVAEDAARDHRSLPPGPTADVLGHGGDFPRLNGPHAIHEPDPCSDQLDQIHAMARYHVAEHVEATGGD